MVTFPIYTKFPLQGAFQTRILAEHIVTQVDGGLNNKTSVKVKKQLKFNVVVQRFQLKFFVGNGLQR